MWHMKNLGIGKGKASPGRSPEVSCGIDSGGQTRREPWTWDLGATSGWLGRRHGWGRSERLTGQTLEKEVGALAG